MKNDEKCYKLKKKKKGKRERKKYLWKAGKYGMTDKKSNENEFVEDWKNN